jgi:ABC-type proline/glycine betaine transport system permease subunit
MTNSKPKICIEHLIKIYGEKPHAALKMFRDGKSKDDILQATLHVLGIADVSLTVNQGQLFVGIRQVSQEVVEAAIAFGSTPWQVLWEAQIPLAMPTILTGLNQTILFALGMSVVTSMIAVPGLGLMVLQG